MECNDERCSGRTRHINDRHIGGTRYLDCESVQQNGGTRRKNCKEVRRDGQIRQMDSDNVRQNGRTGTWMYDTMDE